MENQSDYISYIKHNLKKKEFVIKNNLCYKISNNVLMVVFFHKRADGVYNTELGISTNIDVKPSIKNMDIIDSPAVGLNIKKEDVLNDYNGAILNFILSWLDARCSFENIISLYKNGNELGYFVKPELKKLLQEL